MQTDYQVADSGQAVAVGTHKVLRNTYMMLGLTMVPTVIGAFIGMNMDFTWAQQSPILFALGMLAVMFGLFFAIRANSNSSLGVVLLLVLTGFMGVMLGPIMGPTLGGYLTENFDWRWVFFINLPFGLLALAGVMASESRSATSTGGRLRSLLVSGEVAAAVLLLCGAGLLLQTLLTLVGGDTGYRSPSESVLTLDFSVVTGKNSRYATDEAVMQFYDAVARDVRA